MLEKKEKKGSVSDHQEFYREVNALPQSAVPLGTITYYTSLAKSPLDTYAPLITLIPSANKKCYIFP